MIIIKKHKHRQNERGNVMAYIFFAVILLAALSFAVSRSSRSGGNAISEERARLLASEIIEYSNIVSSGISQMRLRGVDESELCFDDPSWPAATYNHAGCADDFNKLFHLTGAGLSYTTPRNEFMASSPAPDNLWHFYGNNEISNIGTTCGAAACADLIFVVDELDQTLCIKINDLLGITNPLGVPPTDSNLGETLYIGAFAADNVIGDEAGGVNIEGKISACFEKTGLPAEYVFYKVLIAR